MESAAKRRGAHTDSESNSFDKRDDMSEDDLTVIGGKDDDLVTVCLQLHMNFNHIYHLLKRTHQRVSC